MIETLLFSTIGKAAIAQKFKGDLKVQVSSTGFEVTARAIKQKDLKLHTKLEPSLNKSCLLGGQLKLINLLLNCLMF